MKYHIIPIILGVIWCTSCGNVNQSTLRAQTETQAIIEILETRGYLTPNEINQDTREAIQDRLFLLIEGQATQE